MEAHNRVIPMLTLNHNPREAHKGQQELSRPGVLQIDASALAPMPELPVNDKAIVASDWVRKRHNDLYLFRPGVPQRGSCRSIAMARIPSKLLSSKSTAVRAATVPPRSTLPSRKRSMACESA